MQTCTRDPFCKVHPDEDCPDPEDWTLAKMAEWAEESDD